MASCSIGWTDRFCETEEIFMWGEWQNLWASWFKCGVDVTFFDELNVTGIGMVNWDTMGGFVVACVLSFLRCLHVNGRDALDFKRHFLG